MHWDNAREGSAEKHAVDLKPPGKQYEQDQEPIAMLAAL